MGCTEQAGRPRRSTSSLQCEAPQAPEEQPGMRLSDGHGTAPEACQNEAPQRRHQGWRRLQAVLIKYVSSLVRILCLQAVLLLHHRLLLRRGAVSAADPRGG